jgi:hypothetical protein
MPSATVPAAAPGLPTARRRRASSRQLVAKPIPGIPFPDLASIPEIYGMKLTGDCLAPELIDGDESCSPRLSRSRQATSPFSSYGRNSCRRADCSA